MFAKFVGRRVTAVATALAVVVGLAITPAFTATAAEGDDPVVAPAAEAAPLVELVETPPAPPAEPVIEPVVEPVAPPVAPPVEAPVEEAPAPTPVAPAPLVEPVETSTEEAPAPQQMRSSAPESLSLGIQAAGISPSSIPNQILGQPIDIQFSGVDADRWTLDGDWLSEANLSNSGRLTGSFSQSGVYTLTVRAQERWVFGYRTIESKRYTFTVLPAVLTTSLPDATVGVAYSETLTATRNGDILVSDEFTVVSGTLPSGLSLNRSTGKITGTVTTIPTSPVTYNFAVRLTHDVWFGGSYHSDPQPLSITVGYPAPVVNATQLPNATVGAPYSAPALTATGQGSITWTATGLPAGLSIDSATGVISGSALYNATYGASKIVSFTATASNGRNSVPTTFSISVLTPAPQFGGGNLPAATVGVAYDVTLPLHNAHGVITFSLAAGTLPAGMELTADGRISGTPNYDAAGGASKYVQVWVLAQGTAGWHIKRFNFTVITPPVAITTTAIAAGWWNQPYSQAIAATGPGVVVSVTGLPTGLSFDGTTISGSTSLVGTHTVTVTATNSAGTVDRELNLVVNDNPNLRAMAAGTVETGEAYTSKRVKFAGEGVQLALGSDAPSGMTLNHNDRIKWTPAAAGVYTFTVTATNPAGSDSRTFTVRVLDAPVITQGDLDQAVKGMAFRQKLKHDGTNVKFSVVRGDLPAGMQLTRKGVLKGTATEAGTFTIKVRAKNPVGVERTWFTLTVLEPAMTVSASTIIRGNSLTVKGSGYLPGDTLELWLHSTPVLLGTVTAVDGTFTSTVKIPAGTAAGKHHLVVNSAQSGTQSVPLTVAAPPAVPQRPQATPQSPSAQIAAAPASDTPAPGEAAEEDVEETETETEPEETEEEELPTLDQPEAEEEAAAEAPANLSGLLYAAFALLLAALVVWFILWRRRRATDN